MSADAAARQVYRNQPWLARIERARTVPTVADVEALSDLYRAPGKVRRRLVALSRDLLADTAPPARMVISRAAGKMQDRIGRIEQSSARIAHFHPIAVAGLLQTEAYACAVFASGGDLPPEQRVDALAARMQRQHLLDVPGREFVFLLTEGVLRWPLGGPALMAAQLDRIVERSRLPHVRVGVFPCTSSVSVAPMNGFDLYDHRAVVVGSESATAFLTNAHDVAAYAKLFVDLAREAVWAEDARSVIVDVAAEYRSLI